MKTALEVMEKEIYDHNILAAVRQGATDGRNDLQFIEGLGSNSFYHYNPKEFENDLERRAYMRSYSFAKSGQSCPLKVAREFGTIRQDADQLD